MMSGNESHKFTGSQDADHNHMEGADPDNVVAPSQILDCNYPYDRTDSGSGADDGDEDESFHDLQPCFTFESDHEALRGNQDYARLLKTLAVLQAQKIQAVKDVDTLLNAREEALREPLKFVEKLQSGETFDFPAKIAVAEIPDIQWEKYRVNSPAVARKPETRFKGAINWGKAHFSFFPFHFKDHPPIFFFFSRSS